jgi:hypothetical protein
MYRGVSIFGIIKQRELPFRGFASTEENTL